MSLKEDIENGHLYLNALSKEDRINKFLLAIKGKEVSTALIRSFCNNTIRIYRGYGKEVAEYKPANIDRILDKFIGIDNYYLSILDLDGNVLDFISFKGKLDIYLDAYIGKLRFETALIYVVNY
jgi:hypothetical protein